MSIKCEKCEEIIPHSIIINGVQKSLRSRKFCLKCSPRRSENKTNKYSQKQIDAVNLCNYRKALKMRRELQQKSGGKCKICGYNKNERVLSFHHRNPKEKLFELSLNNLCKNKEEIYKEWEKCDLICMNCHCEIENEIKIKNKNIDKIIKNTSQKDTGQKEKKNVYNDHERKCRKCGDTIPGWITIEGKQKNLQNRKFCLNCSPFGNHNTSPNDPIKRVKREWKNYSKECKNNAIKAKQEKRWRIRTELYQFKGGKCKICGYANENSLSFHHRDPSTKSFNLCINNFGNRTKEKLYEEVEKCDLLCLNCHVELEDKISRQNPNNRIERINKLDGTDY